MTTKTLRLENSPKRKTDMVTNHLEWYEYYAGYSTLFVKDLLMNLDLPRSATVMDPWNGTGTTTDVAEQMGYFAIGLDINPVMVLIAKGRRVWRNYSKRDILTLTKQIVDCVLEETEKWCEIQLDPLSTWFQAEGVTLIRKFERAIQYLLSPEREYKVMYTAKMNQIPDILAFFYVALFRTLRQFSRKFKSQNPTWLKKPKTPTERIKLQAVDLYTIFEQEVLHLLAALDMKHRRVQQIPKNTEVILDVATSEQLPITDNTVNLVLTSPPYCTRIDYAMLTSIELALLRCYDIRTIRESMIGTPTIKSTVPKINEQWGKTTLKVLEQIAHHPSKASSSYYYKTYIQYFDAMFRSLQEINRVLIPNGYCVLVIQDSYYKDIHVPLQQMMIEMGQSMGWDVVSKQDFPITQSMLNVNKRARKYRKSLSLSESVICFQK